MPNDIIKEHLLPEKFRVWLDVWIDHSMGGDLAISDIGKKLLPKFLEDDYGTEYQYAKDIIDIITQIKPKKSADGITNREEVVLAWDSYWVADAFEKYASLIGRKCSVDVIFNIADKLNRALEYKQRQSYANIGNRDRVYRITIERVPAGNMDTGEIKFEDNSYKCIVKQFSEDQLKNVDRENDFWALHNITPQTPLKSFSFKTETKDLFVENIKRGLPESIEWKDRNNLKNKLLNIYDGLYSDYSSVWCRSLKDGPEFGNDAKDILAVVLRDVLFARCEKDIKGGKRMLKEFLSERYKFPIFRRLVLLCIDRFWTDYSSFLNKIIEIIPDILLESDFEVEMQDFFYNHNADFRPELITKVKELILNIPECYKKEGDKGIAYWKYKWFSPLRENKDFKVLYEEAMQKAQIQNGNPYESQHSLLEGGMVGYTSSLTKEDLLQMDIPEIVKYLEKFKEEGSDWQVRFEGAPSKRGLAEVLYSAVKEDPCKFTDDLLLFLKTDYLYLHNILRGFKDAWNAGKDLDLKNIFGFCIKYFKRDKTEILTEALKAQGEDSGDGKYIWVVEDVVDLIADVSKDDNRAFDLKYFESVDKVFDLVLPLLKGEKCPDTQRDALSYALNTTLGRTVMAYVSFSLRVARATKKKIKNWGRNKYERFLSIGIDAYIWFGSYLPQMNYLDEEYTKQKIEYFVRKTVDDFEWQMFMEGYLKHSSLYDVIYDLMRDNYIKALECTAFEEYTEKRLVQHISFGYLQYDEVLKKEKNANGKDSLFRKMLNEAQLLGKQKRWLEIPSFFWSNSGRDRDRADGKESISNDIKNKILDFWQWTYDKRDFVRNNLGELYNDFLGRLAKLTILLDKINEDNVKKLLLCAPQVGIDHSSSLFIEYLTKFAYDDESVKHLGKIFLKLMERSTPTYREEDIELIVRRIYEKGNPEDAEKICGTYGRRGIHFLRPVWEEFNKKKRTTVSGTES